MQTNFTSVHILFHIIFCCFFFLLFHPLPQPHPYHVPLSQSLCRFASSSSLELNWYQRLQRCYCTTYNCCIMPEVLFLLCVHHGKVNECLNSATILPESQTNWGIYGRVRRRRWKNGNVITPTAEPVTTTIRTRKKKRRCTRRRNIAIEIRNARYWPIKNLTQ